MGMSIAADAIIDYYDREYGHDGADALGTACRDAIAYIDVKARNALDTLSRSPKHRFPGLFKVASIP
jgi:hypothetical protein